MALENTAWLCALFCISQVLSAPIKCQLDGHLIKTSYNLLKDMGGNFPQQCIKENVLVPFPRSAFASNGTAGQSDIIRTVIYETLYSINSLFENDDFPTDWDEIKLQDFQNIIYRQVDKSTCAGGSKPGSDDSARTATLRNYFERLASVLQEKNFFCAWEIVRKELVRTLDFIIEHNSDSLLWPKRI
uniref:IFN4 n=1 Tax=Anguilla japonica TaxID=7937 RepID=A0A3G3LQ62_ANGJA|nr:IFN4 precursor [Anguilla japonica]